MSTRISVEEQIESKQDFSDFASPPDSKTAWVICAGSFFCMMLSLGTANSFGAYEAFYKENTLKTTKHSDIAWIGTTGTAVLLFSGIFVSRIAISIGFRFTCWIGGVLGFVGLFSASFCSSVGALIATQGVIFGLGIGFVYGTALSVVSMWFEKYRGAALGIVTAGSGIGGIVMSRIIIAILNKLGFRWALRITSFIFVGIILIAAIPFRTRIDLKATKQKIVDVKALKSTVFLCILLCGFVGNLGFIVPVFFPPTAIAELGASSSKSSFLVTLFNIGFLVGSIINGNLSDHFGGLNIFAASTILCGLYQIVLWVGINTINSITATTFLYGFSLSGFILVGIHSIGNYCPKEKIPSYNGLYLTSNGISLICGNFLVSLFLDTLGKGTKFTYVVIFSSACMIVASFFTVYAIFYVRRNATGPPTWKI
ncbi:hypothetical protein BB558_006277 [Smittium angustum]|uniref:Major facilitator superfamily (MFS) profile domain-containing protein n=1 Tax=Smittium angustum TaxID=133377 RepID=A0A2U1IY60_SMIAN|nr:hypothetical protein BB558_006731 [Smittium angustum]PVZ97755.1 hypothetical protein BB558_006277 [Smittium angustum]